MKYLLYLLVIINFISCEKKQNPIDKQQQTIIPKKAKMVSVAIEDVITTLTIENRQLLISELEKPHKHNDFVSIETNKEPISILFEEVNGKMTYTGVQNEYNKHNEKREYIFTTLTDEQFKKLKETGESGWKD